MRHARRVFLLLVLTLAPAVAAAVMQPSGRGLESAPRPTRQNGRRAEPATPADPEAWLAFRGRHGDWRATWGGSGYSPRMAVGPPIALLDDPADAPAVDRAVRRFVASNHDLFGAPTLELVRCQRVGRVWYVSYRQNLRGVPVLFEDWEFRVNERGGLMAFRAGERAVDPALETRPRIGAGEARDRARVALALDPSTARIEGGENLYLAAPEGGTPRLAREVRGLSTSPPAHWVVLVDAEDGRVLWRHDRVRYAVTGTVSGEVHTDLPSDTPVARPFRNQSVTVGAASAVTNAAGAYSAAASGSVTVGMQLQGPYSDVNRAEALDASFSTTVTNPAVVDQQWNAANSDIAERDAFYHVNRVHAELKGIDPGFVGNDYPMPVAVNIGNTCNAFWDGYGVNFFMEGGGCTNTGTMPDVIYHEYGHGVNDNLYVQAGSGIGMSNGALHEGLADVLAAMIQDNPIMGKGFYGPGTWLRTLDNTLRWPEDGTPDGHITGLILGGGGSVMNQSAGLATAAQLSHLAKYGIPDDFDDGVAMGEFFIETLVADDDDGNLSNGSPHSTAIAEAFNAHGIGTGALLSIGHAPPGDQAGPSPYPLYAYFSNGSPLGTIVPGSQEILYSINGSPYAAITMTPTGSGNEFLVNLPVPEGSIVRYYFRVADTYGGVRVEPYLGAENPYVFLAGSYIALLTHDHETNAGWSVGYPGDGASTGIWEWTEPTGVDLGGVYSQPETDHTPSGIFCFVTGNALVGYPPGTNDVDDGATTVATGVLDLSSTPNPVIEYYRWYTNYLGGAPYEDTWRTYITSTGGAIWEPVESTNKGASEWQRVVFFVRDHVTPSSLVRMRFTAEDAGEPSLIEAAVDDFRVLYFTNPALDVAPVALARPAGITASPNPSAAETRIEFRVPSEGPATVALYDVGGRLVRRLFAGSASGGSQVVRWDGRDRHGAAVATGLYLARLTSQGRDYVCRIARTR